MDFTAFYRFVLQRMGERSTYVGIVAILTACGIAIEPDQLEAAIAIGAAIGGTINILWKERPSI